MRKLSIILFLILSFGGIAFGQSPETLLKQVRQIKLLESSRDDVKRILVEFEATDDNDHYQEFSNDDVDIEVTYATGTCSDDPQNEDASDVWNVPEWKVTRIEITPNNAIKLEKLGVDL